MLCVLSVCVCFYFSEVSCPGLNCQLRQQLCLKPSEKLNVLQSAGLPRLSLEGLGVALLHLLFPLMGRSRKFCPAAPAAAPTCPWPGCPSAPTHPLPISAARPLCPARPPLSPCAASVGARGAPLAVGLSLLNADLECSPGPHSALTFPVKNKKYLPGLQ